MIAELARYAALPVLGFLAFALWLNVLRAWRLLARLERQDEVLDQIYYEATHGGVTHADHR